MQNYIPHNLLTGKDDSLDCELGMTSAVVLRMVEPLQNRGHHLYMDNLYTSPKLFRELHLLGFEACGTLRLNRKGVPPEVKTVMKKGERRRVALDDDLNIVQWHDKRVVSILSTLHGDSPVEVERRSRHAAGGREVVEKPEAITEYNKFMGGVDKGDQLLSYYGFPHRTIKWWKRAFFFLFDAAIVNSYIMYTKSHSTGRKLTHEQFRIQLAKELLELATTMSTTTAPLSPSVHGPHHQHQQPLTCLQECHFPGQYGKSESGRQIQRCCGVCSNKKGRGKKTTIFYCKECDIPMCIIPCFELHHTKIDPSRYL